MSRISNFSNGLFKVSDQYFPITTFDRPQCTFCGETGTKLYADLQDELFNVPGSWGFRRCGNPDCGLIWLDPAPLASELYKTYLNYYTHTDSVSKSPASSTGWLRARFVGLYGHLVHYSGLLRARKRLLLRHLDTKGPGRLLEIGCGEGNFLSSMRGLGWQVTGVDSDPKAAQAAWEKHEISILTGRFEDCEFLRDHFDVVVMNHVIEHVVDPATLLAACADILRSEGVMLLVTPNSAGLGHTVFRRKWMGLDPPRHLQIFCPGLLEQIVQHSGLRCIDLSTTSVNAEAFFWGSTGMGMVGERNSSPPSWHLLLLSWIYQYYALANKLWNRKGGEEIVLVCQKNPLGLARE